MVVLALALVSGILLAAFSLSQKIAFIIAISLCAIVLAVAVAAFIKKSKKLAFFLIIFVLGFGIYALDYGLTNPKTIEQEIVYIEGRIDQVGADKEYGSTFYLEDIKIDGEDYNGRVQLVSGEFIRVSVGQQFLGDAKIASISLDAFDTVAMSYDRNNVRYTGTVEGDCVIVEGGKLSLAEKVRERMGKAFDRVLEKDQRGVAESLLFGDRAYLDGEDYYEIKSAGLAHIFSVSGLHVAFLVVIFMWIQKKLHINQYVSFVVTILSLFAYQALCGYSPSIMRAIVMTAIVLLAKILKRRVDPMTSLFTAVTVLLVFNPSTLFDVGFLMSVGSIAGIILFATPIYRTLKKTIKLDKLSLSVGTSISANAGLLPIMSNVFGTFNIYFIPANFIVLPVVSVLYTLLIIGGFLGAITPTLSVLLYPSKYLIIALLFVAKVITELPFSNIVLPSIGVLSIFYYALLINISRFNMIEKKTKLISSAIILLLFLIGLGILILINLLA